VTDSEKKRYFLNIVFSKLKKEEKRLSLLSIMALR